jgi:hypothetical protein
MNWSKWGCGLGMAVLLQLNGCAGPRNYVARVPKAQRDLFNCAQSWFRGSNYGVLESNKQAGFIWASKEALKDPRTQIFANVSRFDDLKVSINANSNGSHLMRVTAATFRGQSRGLRAGARDQTEERPSRSVILDAESIMSVCAGQTGASTLVED